MSSIRCVLLDIEGTTTPIGFVVDVLFPFARTHLKDFLKRNFKRDDIRMACEMMFQDYQADLRQKHSPPSWTRNSSNEIQEIAAYVEWLMNQDRKATGLKVLQGMIWEEGYRKGDLKGQVFKDVPGALVRWEEENVPVCSFSSGSILAQDLLFSNSESGNLKKFFTRFFDTATGPKLFPDSYLQIAKTLNISPEEILFISDVVGELDAAKKAGMQTLLSIRPGNKPQPESSHPIIRSFDEINTGIPSPGK